MPFWSAERLSDAELRNLAAYLAIDAPLDPGSGQAGPDDDPQVPDGNCTTDHPRVGWIAALETLFHDVRGTAEIVDDCTIVIRNFYYDGEGIDVRIYGAKDGDYHSGFPMTPDLLRDGGYEDAVIVAQLPEERTLDEVDGVSVWCVDVGVDFGSDMFRAP